MPKRMKKRVYYLSPCRKTRLCKATDEEFGTFRSNRVGSERTWSNRSWINLKLCLTKDVPDKDLVRLQASKTLGSVSRLKIRMKQKWIVRHHSNDWWSLFPWTCFQVTLPQASQPRKRLEIASGGPGPHRQETDTSAVATICTDV